MSDRLLTVLIVIAVAGIVGTLAWRGYFPEEAEETVVEQTVEAPVEARSMQIRARLLSCDRGEGGKTIARGIITNIGNADLHFVTVNVHWLNSLGQAVEINEVYVLNDEKLPPGKEKSFINATTKTTAASCNVEKVNWW